MQATGVLDSFIILRSIYKDKCIDYLSLCCDSIIDKKQLEGEGVYFESQFKKGIERL